MNNRKDAVYARQSIDKKDSISIESQIDFCKYELKGGNCKEYTDKGYSGKNTDRPRFKELVRDIEQGLIKRVIVYKLDRISRSIIDFASMMELFNRYKVEFVSSTEKFDTSTPMGRAMLNICIVLAQLERETIQKRVTDAYYSRCQKGIKMGGKTPYGYKLASTVIDGVNTKMLVADPETANHVRLMFEMYAQPNVCVRDITRYFSNQGITVNGKDMYRGTATVILKNPIYAKSDLELYEFFKTQGAVITNDAADFNGINGCYLYRGRDVIESKKTYLKGQMLVLAPHEGLVSSETWLAVRKRFLGNETFGGKRRSKSTWLAGKIKCGRCGKALVGVHGNGYSETLYFRCQKRVQNKSCKGCGTIRVRDLEQFIYGEMLKKMGEFQTLTGGNPMKTNPKLTALNVEPTQVETKIEKLLETLTGASPTLLSYANGKIEELDTRRQGLMKAIADMSAEVVSQEKITRITDHLDNWDTATLEDRRLVVDGLMTKIRATSENVQIEWII
ncbi:MAG: recombinase family protein [Defluviitaleaceae bacterium]|nr:recombinase family protein [Defluviitaleaceae bacterium]